MSRKRSGRKLIMPLLAVFVLAATAGCGTVSHNLDLQKDYMPKADSTVEVGEVSNDTGKTFDFVIEDILKEALSGALSDEELLRSGSNGPSLMTNCRILTYEEGNAFKRGMLPGWGSTVLSVRCDLLDSGRMVGHLDALRTVDFGGIYTLGAWRQVFWQVAQDVVQEFKAVIPRLHREE